MRGSWSACVWFVVAVTLAAPAAASHSSASADGLPANLWVAPEVRPMLAGLVLQSPTLRRQCAGIARAPHVHVILLVGPATRMEGRAQTVFRRYGATFTVARVQVPVGMDFAELVAHELEHVLEQIEGVDLPAWVRSGRRGAWLVTDGVYETTRARAAGERARVETLAPPDPVARAVGRTVSAAVRHAWRALRLVTARPRGTGQASTLGRARVPEAGGRQ